MITLENNCFRNEKNEDSCTSDSLSVSGEEIDNDNFTLPHDYVG